MSRAAVEAMIFVALAVVIHAGLWWRMPSGTLAASGDGGEVVITMAAVTPQMIEMIESFETPPEPFETPQTAELLQPVAPVQDVAPRPPPPRDAPTRSAAQELPDLDIPGVDLTSVQAPPPPSEPPDVAVGPPIDLNAVAPVPETARIPSEPAPQKPPRTAPPELALLTPPPSPALPPAFNPPPPPPETDAAQTTSPRPPARPDRPAPPREPQRQAAPTPQQQAVPSNRTQTGRAEQHAVGSGGGQAAGNAGQSENAGLSSARRESLLANWGSNIRSRIERRKSHARGVQGTGTATVRLVVTTDGRLAGISLVGSSGIAEFDEAALNAVRRAGRFAKAPRDLGSGQHSFTLPIRFQQ